MNRSRNHLNHGKTTPKEGRYVAILTVDCHEHPPCHEVIISSDDDTAWLFAEQLRRGLASDGFTVDVKRYNVRAFGWPRPGSDEVPF